MAAAPPPLPKRIASPCFSMQNIRVKISVDKQKQPPYTSIHRKQYLIEKKQYLTEYRTNIWERLCILDLLWS
jgi:hypothetical protein